MTQVKKPIELRRINCVNIWRYLPHLRSYQSGTHGKTTAEFLARITGDRTDTYRMNLPIYLAVQRGEEFSIQAAVMGGHNVRWGEPTRYSSRW